MSSYFLDFSYRAGTSGETSYGDSDRVKNSLSNEHSLSQEAPRSPLQIHPFFNLWFFQNFFRLKRKSKKSCIRQCQQNNSRTIILEYRKSLGIQPILTMKHLCNQSDWINQDSCPNWRKNGSISHTSKACIRNIHYSDLKLWESAAWETYCLINLSSSIQFINKTSISRSICKWIVRDFTQILTL